MFPVSQEAESRVFLTFKQMMSNIRLNPSDKKVESKTENLLEQEGVDIDLITTELDVLVISS